MCPRPARTESNINSHRWHPAAGGKSQQGMDLVCPFFLRRLTDPALTEVFSDHSDLIARGKHFLAITSAPVLARWVFPSARRWQEQPATAHSRPRARAATARLAQALRDGCCLQWCPCLLRALGGPGEAGSPRPPSAWRRLPGKPSVARRSLAATHPSLSHRVQPG